MNRTPLYPEHQALGAKLVDFAGWEMPINYGSQIEEHNKVRKDAGMFDVSHMLPIDVQGPQAQDFLRHVLANDVARLQQLGKALYTCMLNDKGGVIDDLIVYYLAPNQYRIIVNAGTREKDLNWLKQQAKNFSVEIKGRTDLAIIAIQGPHARNKVSEILEPKRKELIANLKMFSAAMDHNWLIARTGYTGEDGLEIILPANEAQQFWQELLRVGVSPCGLGARDTLRLEAGLNLYGSDMDETVTPLESNLTWTVMFNEDRDFIGRKALEQQQQAGLAKQLVGFVLTEKGVLRSHQKIFANNKEVGEITSGSFSPTLGCSIALARIAINMGENYQVNMRDKLIPIKMVKPPFVKQGKKNF